MAYGADSSYGNHHDHGLDTNGFVPMLTHKTQQTSHPFSCLCLSSASSSSFSSALLCNTTPLLSLLTTSAVKSHIFSSLCKLYHILSHSHIGHFNEIGAWAKAETEQERDHAEQAFSLLSIVIQVVGSRGKLMMRSDELHLTIAR